MRIVIDTNVFVAAMRSSGGASREVIRRALLGRCEPLFSNPLWLEYEALLGRPVWTDETSDEERRNILGALASRGRWIKIYFGWRPNLRDPSDDFLVELAVAGSASAIVTHNRRDLLAGEIVWPAVKIVQPAGLLEMLK